MSLLNWLPCVLETCSRANVPCVLTCLACLRACQRASRAYMLTCQGALHAYEVICQHVLCAHMLHANVPWVLTCLTCQYVLRAFVFTCRDALNPLLHMVCVTAWSHLTILLACLLSSFDVTFFSFTAIVVELVHNVGKVWQFKECLSSVTWIHI